MRISDWSSDVCSSDLALADLQPFGQRLGIVGVGGELVGPDLLEVEPEGERHHDRFEQPDRPGKMPVDRQPGEKAHRRDRGIDDEEREAGPADEQRPELTPEAPHRGETDRSEEHTSELQSLMRNSYAVFCLKK